MTARASQTMPRIFRTHRARAESAAAFVSAPLTLRANKNAATGRTGAGNEVGHRLSNPQERRPAMQKLRTP